MVGGIIGGLCAALPGLVDLLSLRGTPVLPTALKHMGLNLVIVVLYVINAWMRWDASTVAPAGAPLVLSVISILMLLVSGWLGGKMVYEAGVAVHAEDMGMTAAGDRAAQARASTNWGSSGAASMRWRRTSRAPDATRCGKTGRPPAVPRTTRANEGAAAAAQATSTVLMLTNSLMP
jgi:hypothetical protein